MTRVGAIAVTLRFGSAPSARPHFHCVVIDGVLTPAPNRRTVFHSATSIDARAIATVQAKVRRRLLAGFVHGALPRQDDAEALAQSVHDSGSPAGGPRKNAKSGHLSFC